ncbi:hypothetical protein E2C01_015429 [Portunus trituberculatus]|uniref:Uncharacterized protein n=1 Tax=Portunus trituberculatus TaxID=210409 RepID=A0A5B7DMJ5_PORTR|nr:hypothetical protein [Portunus trituberculatus]
MVRGLLCLINDFLNEFQTRILDETGGVSSLSGQCVKGGRGRPARCYTRHAGVTAVPSLDSLQPPAVHIMAAVRASLESPLVNDPTSTRRPAKWLAGGVRDEGRRGRPLQQEGAKQGFARELRVPLIYTLPRLALLTAMVLIFISEIPK